MFWAMKICRAGKRVRAYSSWAGCRFLQWETIKARVQAHLPTMVGKSDCLQGASRFGRGNTAVIPRLARTAITVSISEEEVSGLPNSRAVRCFLLIP